MSGPGAAPLNAKKKTIYAQEQDEAERAAWRDAIAGLDPTNYIFIDETSTTLNMTRRYARARRKERAYGSVPRNYGTRTTLIAALGVEGMGAAMTLPGAANAEAVTAYVAQVLCPTLQPGQLVFMDNLSAHKAPDIQALIEAQGCELRWLPRYSPDCTPIELAFAKLKAYLRTAQPRTQTELDIAIREALETITASDARGWFKHCGHELPAQHICKML